jgi:hypothetical protein
VRDCQSTYRIVGFMFNLQNQSADFGFRVGDFSTEINGNTVGIKHIFEKIKNCQRNGTKVSRL